MDGATIRVALISGGQGEESAQRGTDSRTINGETVEISGCKAGKPGAGGKINAVKLRVAAGQQFHYECVAGGQSGQPSADSYHCQQLRPQIY